MSEKRDDVAALGNKAVLQLLELVTEEAKKGYINHIAVIASAMGKESRSSVAGEVCMGGHCIQQGVPDLVNMINGRAANGIMPPRDETLGDDYVCYNTVVSPVSLFTVSWMFVSPSLYIANVLFIISPVLNC